MLPTIPWLCLWRIDTWKDRFVRLTCRLLAEASKIYMDDDVESGEFDKFGFTTPIRRAALNWVTTSSQTTIGGQR